jgi:hypothetical protein
MLDDYKPVWHVAEPVRKNLMRERERKKVNSGRLYASLLWTPDSRGEQSQGKCMRRTACNNRPTHTICADDNKENPILGHPSFCSVQQNQARRMQYRRKQEPGIFGPTLRKVVSALEVLNNDANEKENNERKPSKPLSVSFSHLGPETGAAGPKMRSAAAKRKSRIISAIYPAATRSQRVELNAVNP